MQLTPLHTAAFLRKRYAFLRPAVVLSGLLWASSAYADENMDFFERQLALSALEWSHHRGLHNQLLTGYLLDSSVENALYLEEMPVNLPMNGQGQGYVNTNFLIEELFSAHRARRGPYYAEDGDFSAAGSGYLSYGWPEDNHQITVGVGEETFHHGVITGNFGLNGGRLTYAAEIIGQDIDPDLRNSSAANGAENLVLKYSHGDNLNGYQVSAMAHQGNWRSDDSTEENSGSELLEADASEDSLRYSLSGSWWDVNSTRRWYASGYAIAYEGELGLEFLVSDRSGRRIRPINRRDDRVIVGGQMRYDRFFTRTGDHTVGVQMRMDTMRDVGLSDVSIDQREPGDATLTTSGLYYLNRYQWNSWLQTEASLRLDVLDLSRTDNLTVDFEDHSDYSWSPKLSVLAKPWEHTELFASVGRGARSNDARYSFRGINTFRDSDNPPETIKPLGDINAVDIGFTTQKFDHFLISSSLWHREADFELAARNASVELRPSRRTGVELRLQYQPNDRFYVDLSAIVSAAEFSDSDPRGNHIPGSTEDVATLDIGYTGARFYANLAAYYLGSSPITEDNEVETGDTTAVDIRAGAYLGPKWTLELQWLNVTDSDRRNPDISIIDQVAAIEAFIEELYYQPIPPQTIRFYLRYNF